MGCELDREAIAEARRGTDTPRFLHSWVESIEELLGLFGDGVERVLWREQAANTWSATDNDVLTVMFRVAGDLSERPEPPVVVSRARVPRREAMAR